MGVASRTVAGLVSAVMTGVVVAAVDGWVLGSPGGNPGVLLSAAVVLYIVYTLVAAAVLAANVVWLLGRLLLARFEWFVLPLLASAITWLMLSDANWELITARGSVVCVVTLLISYLFMLNRANSGITHA